MRPAKLKRLEVAPREPDRIAGTRIGVVVAAGEGSVKVDFPGNVQGPVAARMAAALDDAALAAAARERQEAVLMFDDGDPSRPILVTLLRAATQTPMLDAVLGRLPKGATRTAKLDGKRVQITGKEEVVLQCGKASLTLLADGTVLLKGVRVVSQAKETQKIRGAKIQLN